MIYHGRIRKKNTKKKLIQVCESFFGHTELVEKMKGFPPSRNSGVALVSDPAWILWRVWISVNL